MTLRTLLVYQHPSPFVLQDRDLLRKHGEVHEFRWSSHRHPARALPKWMLRHRKDFDVVLIWFGDAHASVATRAAQILRKPSVVVIGGYDVSDAPGYGYLSTKRGRQQAKVHFARATQIAAVSSSLRDQLARHFPEATAKTVVLPTGVDLDGFRPRGLRERLVLSVAGASEWMRAWVKGWDRIAAAARLLPDVPFRLIGAAPDVRPRLEPPKNVEVRGPVAQAELVAEYQRAAVYLQASRSEGLPNTVLEAMASGCVPVVTRVGGMPDLVGDAGFVVGETPEQIASAVRRALDSPDIGPRARARIVDHFSAERRAKDLVRLLEGLAAGSLA